MFDLVIPSYPFVQANKSQLDLGRCFYQAKKAIASKGLYDLALQLFGYAGEGYGIAQIRAQFDKLDASFNWICADPFSFAVDVTTAYIMGQGELILSQAETDGYVKYLNSNLPEWAEIQAPHPLRWYIKLPKDFSVLCAEPAMVLGKQLIDCLPSGRDQHQLIGLFNDIQMLLHSCDLNQKRRMQHQSTVDGVWFWGNGRTVASLKNPIIQNVMTNDLIVYQLAELNALKRYAFIEQPFGVVQQMKEGLLFVNLGLTSSLTLEQYLDQFPIRIRSLRRIYTGDGRVYEKKRWYQNLLRH